jgi:hypothetical protein
VLVLPSVAEAFGLVLVEAMACGLPVIAAEAHGPAEIVAAGTGWLVPPDDEDALTDALVTAASDAEERRRRGARAYRHSHTHYGWPVIATRIAALYAELAAPPAPPAPDHWSRAAPSACSLSPVRTARRRSPLGAPPGSPAQVPLDEGHLRGLRHPAGIGEVIRQAAWIEERYSW